MFGCKHEYGPVKKDGYQYCKKCGKAIVAPCKHEWERIKIVEVENFGQKVGHIYISECKKCLKIRQEHVYSKGYEYLYTKYGGVF
jgi:hypothetical protein